MPSSPARPEDVRHQPANTAHFNFAFLRRPETCTAVRGIGWHVTANPSEVTCHICMADPFYEEFLLMVEVGFDGRWYKAADKLREEAGVFDGKGGDDDAE